MLEKLTNTFGGIVKKISGKSTITEKNIEDANNRRTVKKQAERVVLGSTQK